MVLLLSKTLGVIELTQTNPGCAQGKEKYARSLVSLEAWCIKNGGTDVTNKSPCVAKIQGDFGWCN